MVGSRRIAACVVATVLGAAVSARAAVSVHAEVDASRVGVEDQVQLTITVEGGSAGDVALPPLQNLRQVGGPFESTQVSIVNGAMSQSKSFTFVLQPMTTGKAEVGAAHVKTESGEEATAPIPIEVVAGSVRPRQSRPTNPFDDDLGEDPFASLFGSRRQRTEPKLLTTAVASRSKLHVGEALLVTYYLYTQTTVTGVQLADAPTYPGFWAEDLEQPKNDPHGERATVDGVSYVRFPILEKLLFPTKAGKLTVPPATFRLGLSRVSVFDAGPNAVDRSTKPLTITVDPVPTEAGFSGAVGDFHVTAALDRDTVPLGDAATLRFTVAGAGNLKWVDQPPEVKIAGAKIYPPQVKSDLKVGADGMKGSKTWEFVVVPETSGTLEVPPLAFSYFDPTAGALRHADTSPLSLRVPSSATAAGMGPQAPLSAAAPTPAGRLALRSSLDLPSRILPSLGARVVALGLLVTLLLHAGVGAASLLSDRRRETHGRSSARRSVRSALADLERARRGDMSKEQAAALIERTLHGLFGPMEEGASPTGPREAAIREVLGEVQFLRYAPQLGDYSEKIAEAAGRAVDVVRRWA